MGKAKRKQRPQPPRWFDIDTDNCWRCKNRLACGGCKRLKEIVVKTSKSKLEVKDL